MLSRVTLRKGVAATWAAINPVLAPGELGLEEDTGILKYGDGVTAWSSLTTTVKSSSPFGFISTVDLGAMRATDSEVIAQGGANQGIYMRCRDGGTITKVAIEVVAQSGNISVAVYRNSGSGRSAVPGTRLSTSGDIACPAIGYREVALGASVTLLPGDWLAISADNTTASIRSDVPAVGDTSLGLGRQFRQATAHPLPATPSSLIACVGRCLVLIGVP